MRRTSKWSFKGVMMTTLRVHFCIEECSTWMLPFYQLKFQSINLYFVFSFLENLLPFLIAILTKSRLLLWNLVWGICIAFRNIFYNTKTKKLTGHNLQICSGIRWICIWGMCVALCLSYFTHILYSTFLWHIQKFVDIIFTLFSLFSYFVLKYCFLGVISIQTY